MKLTGPIILWYTFLWGNVSDLDIVNRHYRHSNGYWAVLFGLAPFPYWCYGLWAITSRL
jgi:hypothetical protein